MGRPHCICLGGRRHHPRINEFKNVISPISNRPAEFDIAATRSAQPLHLQRSNALAAHPRRLVFGYQIIMLHQSSSPSYVKRSHRNPRVTNCVIAIWADFHGKSPPKDRDF